MLMAEEEASKEATEGKVPVTERNAAEKADEKIITVSPEKMAPKAEERKAPVPARAPPEELQLPPVERKRFVGVPPTVFGKWSSEVEVRNPALREYVCLDSRVVYSTHGRHAAKKLMKKNVHIVERLINNLMRGGTGDKIGGHVIRDRGGTGKKAKMNRVVKDAFGQIGQKHGKNPVEVLVRAVENAAPREETTRVKYGGIMYHIAVDVSPQRMVDLALRNIAQAVAIRSFNNPRKSSTALMEELVLASINDAQSWAITRKNETERVARSSR